MKNWLTTLLMLIPTSYDLGQDGFIRGDPALAYWQIGKKIKR